MKKFGLMAAVIFVVVLGAAGFVYTRAVTKSVDASCNGILYDNMESAALQITASNEQAIGIGRTMRSSRLVNAYFQDPKNSQLAQLAQAELEGYQKASSTIHLVYWINDVDKIFHSTSAAPYSVDPSLPENSWYNLTLKQTKDYNFNINYNANLKSADLWINLPVFDDNGKPIGMLGLGAGISQLMNDIAKHLDQGVTMYYFNPGGIIMSGGGIDMMENKKLVDTLGPMGAEALAKTKLIKQDGTSIEYFQDGMSSVSVNYVEALGWYSMAIMRRSPAMYFGSIVSILFFVMLALIVVTFVAFFVMIRGIVMRMKRMGYSLKEISASGDLTKRITVNVDDEIGTLGKIFNTTFETMSQLVSLIKSAAVKIQSQSEVLDTGASEASGASTEIKTDIAAIEERMTSQSASVTRWEKRRSGKRLSSGFAKAKVSRFLKA
jgi:methyl-accepting chemotaxis protein